MLNFKYRHATIDDYVEMLDGNFPLADGCSEAMGAVRAAIAEASKKLKQCYDTPGLYIDEDAALRSIQLLQQAKDVACQAIILPNAPRHSEPEAVWGTKHLYCTVHNFPRAQSSIGGATNTRRLLSAISRRINPC